MADELVRLKVDLIIAPNTPAAVAAKNATKTIPIVFIDVTDPIAAGLVDSLPRPGGNITGFTTIGSVLAGKRLELLKEIIPKLSRVAVLWNPQDASSAQSWKESQLPARELGLQLHSMDISSADQYETAFKRAIKARSGALVSMASPLGSENQRLTVDLAEKYRLPAIYQRRAVVENGGLMSYGISLDEAFRRGAVFVDKILKGTKPADIPVEQPTKFEFVINLKTASTLNALANSNQKRIAALATKNRLPAIYPREDWVASGGLMSYGPDRADVYKRLVIFVDKILKGAKPADLPVEQPTKFEFIVNLKAAKQIGVTIPPNVLARADRVIR